MIEYTKRTYFGLNVIKEYSRIKSYKVLIYFKDDQTYIFRIKNNYYNKY